MMQGSKLEVVSRFPNGFKQVRVQHGVPAARYMIVDQYDNPVSSETFTGIVYLNEDLFEVYQGEKSGLLHVHQGIDWNVETPNTIYHKAVKDTTEVLAKSLENMVGCPCRYPRIIDYIANRKSEDNHILRALIFRKYFTTTHSTYNQELECEEITLRCKECHSKLKHIFRERGIDEVQLMESTIEEYYGMPVNNWAPAYLAGLKPELFYRESYIGRVYLFKSTLEELNDYLFEKIPL